jgi:hypothetical protein
MAERCDSIQQGGGGNHLPFENGYPSLGRPQFRPIPKNDGFGSWQVPSPGSNSSTVTSCQPTSFSTQTKTLRLGDFDATVKLSKELMAASELFCKMDEDFGLINGQQELQNRTKLFDIVVFCQRGWR